MRSHDLQPEQRTGAAKAREPLAFAPRGLNRLQAAHHVGVCATTFDRAVADGLMPRPRRLYGRKLWLLSELDDALTAALPYDGEEEKATDSWADFG